MTALLALLGALYRGFTYRRRRDEAWLRAHFAYTALMREDRPLREHAS